MEIEDLPPKRPNFMLIVILFGATILLVAFIAVLVIRYHGKNMVPNAATKTNTSQLHFPALPSSQLGVTPDVPRAYLPAA